MAHVWLQQDQGNWETHTVHERKPLEGSELGFPGIQVHVLGAARGAALLVQPGLWIRVNGEPVLGGLRVLEHKDEILLQGKRFYFSSESAPVRVAYRVSEGGRPPTCPICRGPIKDEMQAVCCPGCGRWFHQLDATPDRPAKPCWTYALTCRFCSHPTAFSAEAVWRPDMEESHAV